MTSEIDIQSSGLVTGYHWDLKEFEGTLKDEHRTAILNLFSKFDILNLESTKTRSVPNLVCDGGGRTSVKIDEEEVWSDDRRCGECYPEKSCEFASELRMLISEIVEETKEAQEGAKDSDFMSDEEYYRQIYLDEENYWLVNNFGERIRLFKIPNNWGEIVDHQSWEGVISSQRILFEGGVVSSNPFIFPHPILDFGDIDTEPMEKERAESHAKINSVLGDKAESSYYYFIEYIIDSTPEKLENAQTVEEKTALQEALRLREGIIGEREEIHRFEKEKVIGFVFKRTGSLSKSNETGGFNFFKVPGIEIWYSFHTQEIPDVSDQMKPYYKSGIESLFIGPSNEEETISEQDLDLIISSLSENG